MRDPLLDLLEVRLNENKVGSIETVEEGVVFHTLAADELYVSGSIESFEKDPKEYVKQLSDCKKWVAKAEEDLEARLKSVEKLYKKSIYPQINIDDMLKVCVRYAENVPLFWENMKDFIPLTYQGETGNDVWFSGVYMGDRETLIPYDELAVRIQIGYNNLISEQVKADDFYRWKTSIAKVLPESFESFYTLPSDVLGNTYESAKEYLGKLKEETSIKVLTYKRVK